MNQSGFDLLLKNAVAGDEIVYAGFLGITVEQLEDGYGHHHPDFQQDAAEAFR